MKILPCNFLISSLEFNEMEGRGEPMILLTCNSYICSNLPLSFPCYQKKCSDFFVFWLVSSMGRNTHYFIIHSFLGQYLLCLVWNGFYFIMEIRMKLDKQSCLVMYEDYHFANWHKNICNKNMGCISLCL